MSSPWPRRLAALALGLGLVGLAEGVLRVLSPPTSAEAWSPPRLIQVVQDGRVAGEFEVRTGAHFEKHDLSDGTVEIRTAEDFVLGKGQGIPVGGCMRDQRFRPAPEPGVQRFVLLGGSAALGQKPTGGGSKGDALPPYPRGAAGVRLDGVERLPNGVSVLPEHSTIAGYLEGALRKKGHRAEVINAGMIAQDSGGVREIAREVLAFEPHALLLYLGNNEAIGLSFSLGEVEVPRVQAVRGLLRGLRLYQLLAGSIVKARQTSGPSLRLQGIQPNVLGEVALAQWATAGAPLLDGGTPTDDVYRALLARFEANLRTIVTEANEKGAFVYIIPAPPHLGYRPFFMARSPGLSTREQAKTEQARTRAIEAANQGHWTRVLELAEGGLDEDPVDPTLRYLRGIALDATGQFPAAVDQLEAAVATDLSRKRSQPAYGAIAARICAELQAPGGGPACASADAHVAITASARAEGMAVYQRRFGDHEHMNPEGNAWVAGLFAELIEARGR